jgi:hypothetical protein
MIESHQMEHAVEHQNTNFVDSAMPKLAGLRLGALDRDCEIAERPNFSTGRERENISRVIMTQKLKIQPLQRAVSGDEANDTAAQRHSITEKAKEVS